MTPPWRNPGATSLCSKGQARVSGLVKWTQRHGQANMLAVYPDLDARMEAFQLCIEQRDAVAAERLLHPEFAMVFGPGPQWDIRDLRLLAPQRR